MLDHLIAWEVGEARRSEWLKDAEQARLRKEARAYRVRSRDAHWIRLGDLLVAAGEKLREDHGSASRPVVGDKAAQSS